MTIPDILRGLSVGRPPSPIRPTRRKPRGHRETGELADQQAHFGPGSPSISPPLSAGLILMDIIFHGNGFLVGRHWTVPSAMTPGSWLLPPEMG